MIAVVVGKRQEWEQESEKLEEILREIEKSLDEREYYMLLHFVKTAEEFVRYAAVWKLDGVICIWLNEEACTRIRQMCAVPVAAIYRTDRIYGKAGEEVARFLFKREKQRIAERRSDPPDRRKDDGCGGTGKGDGSVSSGAEKNVGNVLCGRAIVCLEYYNVSMWRGRIRDLH